MHTCLLETSKPSNYNSYNSPSTLLSTEQLAFTNSYAAFFEPLNQSVSSMLSALFVDDDAIMQHHPPTLTAALMAFDAAKFVLQNLLYLGHMNAKLR